MFAIIFVLISVKRYWF